MFRPKDSSSCQQPQLNCTGSVTRGGSVTCTVTPSNLTASNWTFQGSGGTVSRTTNTGSLSWSGTMVTGGTLSVTVQSPKGATTDLSASIAVTSRTGFAFMAVAPTQRTSPYSDDLCSVTVPDSPGLVGDETTVGQSCLGQRYITYPSQINDNGPNQGFWYIRTASSGNAQGSTTFNYVIATYVADATSEFATHQCGNYNPTTNPSGYISDTQLLSNIVQHESGMLRGHYIQYKTAQDDESNNLGIAAEAVVGSPDQSKSAFEQQVSSKLLSNGKRIANATVYEDCNHDVRLDTSCTFRGYINLPIYVEGFYLYQCCE